MYVLLWGRPDRSTRTRREVRDEHRCTYWSAEDGDEAESVAPAAAEPQEDEHADCRAVGQILDRVGDKWTVMAVGVLSRGALRFNALQQAIGGVSHRMLTLTLRALERHGLVKRTAYPTIPPKVEYELTELGRSLITPLKSLAIWAQRNRPAMEAARAGFAARAGHASG